MSKQIFMLNRLLPFSLIFFQVNIIGSAGLSDLFILWLTIISIIKFWFKKLYFDFSCIVLTMFLLIILLGFIFSPLSNQGSAIKNLLRVISLSLGYIFIPIWYTDKKRVSLLIKDLLLITFILSILVIIEFICIKLNIPFNIKLSDRALSVNEGRVHTIFSEPSFIGIFISIYMIPIIYYLRNQKKKPIFFYYTLILSLIALTFSSSMTALLLLIFISAGLFLFSKINRPKKILYIIIGLGAILAIRSIPYVNDTYIERIDKIKSMEDSSASQRLIGSWLFTIKSIDNNKMFGIGIGQATAFSERTNINVDYFPIYNKVVNNIYAAVLFELGYFGLIMYILFTILVFKKNYFLLISFILLCFSHGAYIFSIFWFFLYLGRIAIIMPPVSASGGTMSRMSFTDT